MVKARLPPADLKFLLLHNIKSVWLRKLTKDSTRRHVRQCAHAGASRDQTHGGYCHFLFRERGGNWPETILCLFFVALVLASS